MNTAEGGASVSAHPAATASQAFGETSGVSGSNFGPEPSVSQHVGSTADPCMAPGCSSNSVDEGSTLGTSQGAPELARVSSSEAMMLGAPIEASEVADGTAPGGPLFPDRPSDADIIAWENTIREAGPGKQALVGQPEPLSSLAAEYVAGSPVFLSKIQTLEGAYGLIRRTRGDGNCFFRSFVFAFIERMLLMGDDAEKDRVLARLAEVKKQLTEAGYEEMVMETPMDAMLDMVRNIGSPVEPLSIDILEQNMCSGKSRKEKRDGCLAAPSMLTLTMCNPGSQWNNEYISNYVVFLMRMITSCEIRRRSDFFEPFIMGMSDLGVGPFCQRFVDPMDEESDHVPLRVVYLDRSASPGGHGGPGAGDEAHVDMHDFVPESLAGAAPVDPSVHLLYRPGHYDILYPRAG
ncbi:Ubiquitin thioesterase otubain-like protein [Auxenochlorella protothecoides]|uniref:ubiquitinyl hydrolase 1 n=1 Tax=Auxenochlorella protothecoides TaxID=3075 RepID=A0A087SBP0_AUXPR|nr:Ubiquitin thioesterase otubain-like protein [Auxenochlorella protothecoides]KFM23144.1 Ubiquitin thioesterase otubain-like protein [Auxenochlorella protothecoides]RMZ55034.1 hypothetical protein APUTEX25_005660 [Auxenochlorella protothecoides]|eukprot:RMZ55034.1 hypothetical protein APUTEX25_005660 [Auxenochlorella protothecoides]